MAVEAVLVTAVEAPFLLLPLRLSPFHPPVRVGRVAVKKVPRGGRVAAMKVVWGGRVAATLAQRRQTVSQRRLRQSRRLRRLRSRC